MRTVLRNSRKVRLLKSDLQAIVNKGALDISAKPLGSDRSHAEAAESHPELKCNPPPTIPRSGDPVSTQR